MSKFATVSPFNSATNKAEGEEKNNGKDRRSAEENSSATQIIIRPQEDEKRVLKVKNRHKRGGERYAFRGEIEMIGTVAITLYVYRRADKRIYRKGEKANQKHTRIAGIAGVASRIYHYSGSREI